MAKLFYAFTNIPKVVDNVINKVINAKNNVMWKKSMIFGAVCRACENSHEILLLISLNCTAMVYNNDINNQISFEAIPETYAKPFVEQRLLKSRN